MPLKNGDVCVSFDTPQSHGIIPTPGSEESAIG